MHEAVAMRCPRGLMNKKNSDNNNCPLAVTCSGCDYWHLQYPDQGKLKKQHLEHLLRNRGVEIPALEFISPGNSHLRDRLDFSLQGGRLGLYGKGLHDIIDIDICEMLSPALQEWLTEFRKIIWPVEKGSVRLRIGPQGQRGAWLDFANIDIKKILDEKTLLQELKSQSFVEIGQRRKVPVWTGQEFKLQEPELNVWFNSWMNGTPIDLYCHVASFTQPSLAANQHIAQTISTWVQQFPGARLIEFGSGIGNLTLPALVSASKVLACEIDAMSLLGLEKTLEKLPFPLQSHRDKITLYRGDFQRKILQNFSDFDGILANPPRSGLMNFLNPLELLKTSERPRFFIYMSCFPESMAGDLVKLKDFGYRIDKCLILDQFPQSAHYEVLTLLVRK